MRGRVIPLESGMLLWRADARAPCPPWRITPRLSSLKARAEVMSSPVSVLTPLRSPQHPPFLVPRTSCQSRPTACACSASVLQAECNINFVYYFFVSEL